MSFTLSIGVPLQHAVFWLREVSLYCLDAFGYLTESVKKVARHKNAETINSVKFGPAGIM